MGLFPAFKQVPSPCLHRPLFHIDTDLTHIHSSLFVMFIQVSLHSLTGVFPAFQQVYFLCLHRPLFHIDTDLTHIHSGLFVMSIQVSFFSFTGFFHIFTDLFCLRRVGQSLVHVIWSLFQFTRNSFFHIHTCLFPVFIQVLSPYLYRSLFHIYAGLFSYAFTSIKFFVAHAYRTLFLLHMYTGLFLFDHIYTDFFGLC